MPKKPMSKAVVDHVNRLDRVAADLNILLVLFAIGLGIMNLTVLLGENLVRHLPEMMRVTVVDQ